MGPVNISINSTLTIKVTSLPKLATDGSNWTTYQDWVTNTIKAKELHCHLSGTTHKPEDLEEHTSGEFFKPEPQSPLTNDKLETHKKEDQ